MTAGVDCGSLARANGSAAHGTTLTLGGGQSVSALSQKSDVDLLGNDEGVIEFDI